MIKRLLVVAVSAFAFTHVPFASAEPAPQEYVNKCSLTWSYDSSSRVSQIWYHQWINAVDIMTDYAPVTMREALPGETPDIKVSWIDAMGGTDNRVGEAELGYTVNQQTYIRLSSSIFKVRRVIRDPKKTHLWIGAMFQHELAHVFGLGHSHSSNDVFRKRITKRSLSENDKTALRNLQTSC